MGGLSLSTLALVVLGPLLVWRIYARVKGVMVRQESVLSKHWLGLLICLVVLVVSALQIGAQPFLLGYLGAGTAIGIGWGVFGFHRTRLQADEDGYFYTPYAPLGIAVTMLFAARILYIFFDLYVTQGPGPSREPFLDAPITDAAIGFVTGYFLTISAGLLRWRLTTRAE